MRPGKGAYLMGRQLDGWLMSDKAGLMNETILVIDDEEQMRGLLRQILERGGYQVLVAEDGLQGMRVYEDNTVDVVITDLLMPNKEGLETIMEMKSKYPDVRIIAMSGGGRDGVLNFLPAAEKLGAMTTLAKPFGRKDILAAVEAALKGESAGA